MTATPRVSVVVPNYNHARYLPQRMDSILGQTFADFEVIVLDDASTDDSRSVLERYRTDARVRVEYSRRNSGNVFRQWNRGVALSRGDYIWIAESDDYCERTLLERLVPLLDRNPRVGVAYCQSWVVQEGARAKPWIRSLEPAERAHWQADYVADGREECGNYLVRRGFIPNASAALIRRSAYEAAGRADTSFRLTGDYMMWAKLMVCADVAHVAEPLNYWRRHPAQVTAQCARNGVLVEECYRVVAHIRARVAVPPDVLDERAGDLLSRWMRLRGAEGVAWWRHLRIFAAALRADPALLWRLRRNWRARA